MMISEMPSESNRQIVGPQTKRDPANHPGDSSSKNATNGPAEDDRHAGTTQKTGAGRINRLDGADPPDQ